MKALELDNTLAEVHHALAAFRCYTEWDWKGAEIAYRRAIELNPNYPDARALYSHLLMIMGRTDEAMEQIERASELDPFHVLVQLWHGADLYFARRYDEAIAQNHNVLSTEPNQPGAYFLLWYAFHEKGMYEEALAAITKAFNARGLPEVEEALARGYAEAGYPGAMGLAAETLVEQFGTANIDTATLYLWAGKNGQALEWLERSVDARDPNMVKIGVYPAFDSLRDDPRFQDLMRRMNLPR